jgi:hypothetical protein
VPTITIIQLPATEKIAGLEYSAGAWKGIIDAEELGATSRKIV